jgi:hypothetical protein
MNSDGEIEIEGRVGDMISDGENVHPQQESDLIGA